MAGKGLHAFTPLDGLPKRISVLQYACQLLYAEKLKKREAAINTANAIRNVWNDNEMETQLVYRIADKISTLIDEYNAHLYKEFSIVVRDVKKRDAFFDSLNVVFNVAKDTSKSSHRPNQAPAVEPVAIPTASTGPIDVRIQEEYGHGHNLRRKRNSAVVIDEIGYDSDDNIDEENIIENGNDTSSS